MTTRNLYHVHNIKWDTDGQNPETLNLPTEAVIDADPQQAQDDPTLFADTLSDHYGWCVHSLDATPIPDEFPDETLQRLQTLPQLTA